MSNNSNLYHLSLLASLFLYTTHTTHAMEIVPIKNEPSAATLQCLEGIRKGDAQQIKKSLLEHADVNYINNNGESLFSLAWETCNKNIILPIITHPAIDLMTRSSFDYTPLHIACTYGLTETVDSILKKNPLLATLRNEFGETPLMLAAASEHKDSKDCVKSLLSYNKSTIDWKSSYSGVTALHLACRRQQHSIIKELVMHGATSTIQTNEQTTPLILLYSFIDENKWDFFHSFLAENCTVAQQLIKTPDQNKNSQFHLCATIPNISEAKFDNYLLFLASHQLDINARNIDGKRAVDLATEKYTELYNHHKTCKKCDNSGKITKQEQVMHTFLRFISPNTQCALFTHLLEQPSFCNRELVKDITAYIMSLYYALNIETIVAKKYKLDEKYYENSIENKNKIKRQLLIKPEPKLLWSAS